MDMQPWLKVVPSWHPIMFVESILFPRLIGGLKPLQTCDLMGGSIQSPKNRHFRNYQFVYCIYICYIYSISKYSTALVGVRGHIIFTYIDQNQKWSEKNDIQKLKKNSTKILGWRQDPEESTQEPQGKTAWKDMMDFPKMAEHDRSQVGLVGEIWRIGSISNQ